MFSNPEQNVGHLQLGEGMRVADFGAGSGFYSIAASKRVGNSGKVYSIDVQKDLVKKLESELKTENIKNIECIWADLENKGGAKIADGSVDAVIICNILFQAEDKLGLIDEARRVLKKDGKVMIVEWAESFEGMGPAKERIVTEQRAEELFLSRGFKVLEKVSAGPHHYGIIFLHE